VFNNTTLIENAATNANSPFAALLVRGALGPISFETLTANDAIDNAANPFAAIDIQNSSDISFDQLNVFDYIGVGGATTNTAAVSILNSGDIFAGSGTITSTDARAIELIGNQSIAWTSTSISATNDDFGIFVLGNPGHFIVTGVGDTAGSGGFVSMAFQTPAGPEVGAFFGGVDQTEPDNFVILRNMVFDDNDVAIIAQDWNGFELDGVVVSNTGLSSGPLFDNAVDLFDIANVIVTDSTFTNNDFSHFSAEIANDAGEVYDYFFARNQFIDAANRFFGGESMVQIENTGAVGAQLNLTVRDHGGAGSGVTGFISTRSDPSLTDPVFSSDSAAFDVRWNGAANVLVENNSFILLGDDGAKGFEFINGSAVAGTDFVYRGNILENTAIASNTAGLFLDFAGQADVVIENNFRVGPNGTVTPGMTLNGINDSAYVTTFRGAGNTLILEDNLIEFSNDNGTAFEFPFVGGSTLMQINGNVVDFLANPTATAPGERGFVFGPVAGVITFQGNRNNEVNFFSPDIFSDAFFPNTISGSLGSFLLNGQRVPNSP
jgi:hypothetical protein